MEVANMSTSQRTFDQVKSILGKLGRNIDQLREQRLGPTPAVAGVPIGVAPVTSVAATPRIGAQQPNAGLPNSTQLTPDTTLIGGAAPSPTTPGQAKWGRAQPIRD